MCQAVELRRSQNINDVFNGSHRRKGRGVKVEDIFYSSFGSNDIPMTEDFNVYMEDQIQAPKLVILSKATIEVTVEAAARILK